MGFESILNWFKKKEEPVEPQANSEEGAATTEPTLETEIKTPEVPRESAEVNTEENTEPSRATGAEENVEPKIENADEGNQKPEDNLAA